MGRTTPKQTRSILITITTCTIIFSLACAMIYIQSHDITIPNINLKKHLTTQATNMDKTQQETHQLNPLIFTISNYGFLPFIKNWILHLQQFQLNNFNVICTDKQCYNELIHWNKTSFNKEQIILLEINDLRPEYMQFGNKDYKNYVKRRPKIFRWFYNKIYNEFIINNSSSSHVNKTNGILYLDTDIAVIENIIESFQNNNFSKFDMVLQYDSDFENCENMTNFFEEQKQICSCIILIPFKDKKNTNHENINLFIDEWDKGVDDSCHEQLALNLAVYNKSINHIDIGYFNCKEYPTGWHIKKTNWAKNSLLNQSDHSIKIIHSNWMAGMDNKINFFKKFGEWKVND